MRKGLVNVKNKEIFSMLKNADDSVIEQLTDMCEPLDKASDKRIFSRIQKKCGSSSECFETHNDYEVRGVDIYMRPKWIKPLRAAVIALALI